MLARWPCAPKLVSMGIYDRDYYREPPRRSMFASFSMVSVTTWLIIINVAVSLSISILQQQHVTNLLREAFGDSYRNLPPGFRELS